MTSLGAERPSPGGTSHVVTDAALRLRTAQESGAPCAPLRDVIAADDVATAYAIATENIRWRVLAGARVVGHKVGLTSEAVQQQLGVDTPDFGVLLDDMGHADGAEVAIASLMQPRVEAEIAFFLAHDLVGSAPDAPVSVDDVRAAVSHAVASLEIADSRILDWDISLADTVADNASSGHFVLGTTTRTLDDFEPVDVTMEMSIDGEVVSEGTGAACLGDPLLAVAWLATTVRDMGSPLRAGHVVLSGALGPMRPVAAGQRVEALIAGLGTVSVSFVDGGTSWG